MVYMSENRYKSKMDRIKQDNISRQRKRMLWQERIKYWPKLRFPHTSKLVLFVSGAVCLEIIIFCEYVILRTGDTSALYSMVGVVASLVPIILGYYSKSKAENTKDGIIFETAMKEQDQKEVSSNDAVG